MAEEIVQEKQAATAPDAPVAAPEDNLPGKLVSVVESGGTGQKDPSTITGVVRYDIAPQVQGGNQAITDALTAVLSSYDPVLGPNITESLKYPDTTDAGLSALATNFTPQQQVGVLNSLAPYSTNAEHYAHRDPTVEYDVSLLNRPAMMQVAQQQQQTLDAAAQLKRQGELATGDAMQYLASQGVANTSAAIAVADQMRDGLKHMNDAQVHLQQRGNVLASIVQIPTTPVPIMQGIGPVDQQGVWHPTINGYAISTPARQQMMETLQRPDVKQYFQQQGITGVDPKFMSTAEPNLATRPPTQAQTRQNTPTWDQIQADPRFAQLPPERQVAMKKAYFDQFAAMAPPLANAVRQDPKLFSQLQQHFVGPQQIAGPMPQAPSLSQQVGQATTGLLGTGRLTAPLREMVGDVAGLAEKGIAGVKGMTTGFLPPKLEKKLGDLAGHHPIVEELSRMGSNMLAGGPIIGPIVGETARSLVSSGYQGMPAFTNAIDLVKESIPLSSAQPKSMLAAGTRAFLGAQLLNKAAQYAGPTVSYLGRTPPGKLLGKGLYAVAGGVYKGATAAGGLVSAGVKKITPQVVKTVIGNLLRKGSWNGKELSLLERVAAAANKAPNLYAAEVMLEGMPAMKVIEPGSGLKLRVWLWSGGQEEIDPVTFSQLFQEEMDKVLHDPKYVPRFEEALFRNISRIEGEQGAITAFFKTNGAQHLEVATVAQVKGVRMTQTGNKVWVQGGGYPARVFMSKNIDDAWMLANEYVDSLPMVPTSVQDTVYKKILSEGQNPYYILSRVPAGSKMMAEFEGMLPDLPHYGNLTNQAFQFFSLPKENLLRWEKNTGMPTYSQFWLPLDDALRRHKVFSAPWKARIQELLGRTRAWRDLASTTSSVARTKEMNKGYVYLLETDPGSQAWNDVVKQYKLDSQVGVGIRQWFEDLLPKFGLDPEEFFKEFMPQVQQSGLFKWQTRSTVPKSVSFFGEHLQTGLFPLNMRELDIRTLMERTIEEGSWNLNMKQAWEAAYKFADKNKVKMNDALKTAMDTHLRAIAGWGPLMDRAMMELFGKTMQRLFFKGDVPAADAAKLGKQLYAEGYGLNAGQYFAFRPATVVRQYFQTMQTIYPFFGNATFHGIKEYFADPFAKEKLMQAGVLSEFGVEEGLIAKGTAAVRAGDEQQRGFAAYAEQYLWDKHISEYISKKIPWEVFAKLTKVGLFAGPEQRVLRDMITNGETLEAKYLAMRTASTLTNFDYAFENRAPYMTGSLIGRMFGQFGVFPVAFQEYIARGFTRGDIGDRIAWLTRWSGANLVMQETFKLALGADAHNWLWLHPAWFGGGPLQEHIAALPKSLLSADHDAPTLTQAVLDLATTPIVGYSAVKDVVKGMGYAVEGDVQGAARQVITGFPPIDKRGERTKAIKFR